MSLEQSLTDALTWAQLFTGDPAYGGMASVRLIYNPYECCWRAYADWSSGKKIMYEHDHMLGAVGGLIGLLRSAADHHQTTDTEADT